MYNFITHHLYIVLCVHHPKSHLLPSPFIPSIPSSTSHLPPFPLVVTIPIVCIYEGFFFLNPFTLLHPAPKPLFPLTADSLFSVCESVSILFVYFSHWIPHRSEIIRYMSFSTGLFPLVECSPGPSMLSQRVRFLSFFYGK